MYIYSTSDWARLSPHTHALPTGLGTWDCVCPPGVLIRRSWEPDTHRQLWPQPQLFVSAQEGSWSSSGAPHITGCEWSHTRGTLLGQTAIQWGTCGIPSWTSEPQQTLPCFCSSPSSWPTSNRALPPSELSTPPPPTSAPGCFQPSS